MYSTLTAFIVILGYTAAQQQCNCPSIQQCARDRMLQRSLVLASCRTQCGQQDPQFQQVGQCYQPLDNAKQDKAQEMLACMFRDNTLCTAAADTSSSSNSRYSSFDRWNNWNNEDGRWRRKREVREKRDHGGRGGGRRDGGFGRFGNSVPLLSNYSQCLSTCQNSQSNVLGLRDAANQNVRVKRHHGGFGGGGGKRDIQDCARNQTCTLNSNSMRTLKTTCRTSATVDRTTFKQMKVAACECVKAALPSQTTGLTCPTVSTTGFNSRSNSGISRYRDMDFEGF